VRLRQDHAQSAESLSPGTELTGGDARGHAIEDDPRQKFGGGVLRGEGRLLVQIPVVDLGEQLPQHHRRPADVDHQAVGIEHVAANSQSTTKVAPCSRWAGPKISPRKLWATMMWSRTQKLYLKPSLALAGTCDEFTRKDTRNLQ
jgi:hypothetical protein